MDEHGIQIAEAEGRLSPSPPGPVDSRILTVRGLRVIIDADLAGLYGVTSKRLTEQVRRNRGRFPADFAFQLTREEVAEVAANCGHLRKLKFSRQLRMAFSEHGAIMAASVLNSERAVEMSVLVVRAFVRLRSLLGAHEVLARKLADLETRVGGHDEALRELVETIRQLLEPPPDPPPRHIGFGAPPEGSREL